MPFLYWVKSYTNNSNFVCVFGPREIWYDHWTFYLLKTIMFLTVWMSSCSLQSLGKMLGHVPRCLRQVLQQQTMHHWICQAKLESRLITLISDFELAVPMFSCHLILAVILPSPPPQPWEISLSSMQIIMHSNKVAGVSLLALATIGWHLSVIKLPCGVIYWKVLLMVLFTSTWHSLAVPIHCLLAYWIILNK